MSRYVIGLAALALVVLVLPVGLLAGLSLVQALFGLIAGLGLLMALGTVLARNLVHAALYLIGFFFAISCLFVLLEAEFLALIQVLIYIGAVAVLLLFGIMLTRNIQGDETTTVVWAWRVPATLAGLAVFAVLGYGIGHQGGLLGQPAWRDVAERPEAAIDPEQGAAIDDMGRAIGREMMTRYVVAFEVAGLLLTAALVGAVAIAQADEADEPPRPGTARMARPGRATDPASGNGRGNGHPAPTDVLTHGPASAPR